MLIRLLIFIVLGVVIYRALKRLGGGDTRRVEPGAGRAPVQVDDEMIKDPVCGSYFPKREAVTMQSHGRTLQFCSVECRDQYVQEQTETPS